jgi:hypothetical protein
MLKWLKVTKPGTAVTFVAFEQYQTFNRHKMDKTGRNHKPFAMRALLGSGINADGNGPMSFKVPRMKYFRRQDLCDAAIQRVVEQSMTKQKALEITKPGKVVTPSNPSRKATSRVKNPLPIPTNCHLCGSDAVRIGEHREVYGGRQYGEWPYVYLCEGCGSYVGLHPFTAIPLGALADADMRRARKDCKAPFQWLVEECVMTRTEAYEWLAGELGIPVDECHFGWFDVETCHKARAICIKKINKD